MTTHLENPKGSLSVRELWSKYDTNESEKLGWYSKRVLYHGSAPHGRPARRKRPRTLVAVRYRPENSGQCMVWGVDFSQIVSKRVLQSFITPCARATTADGRVGEERGLFHSKRGEASTLREGTREYAYPSWVPVGGGVLKGPTTPQEFSP